MIKTLKKIVRPLRKKYEFTNGKRHRNALYLRGKKRYTQETKAAPPALSPSTLDVLTFDEAQEKSIIQFPEEYSRILERIYNDIKKKIVITKNCYFNLETIEATKILNASPLPKRIENMEEIQKNLITAYYLRQTHDLDGLEDLCALLLPQIERNVFGSYILAEQVTFQRSPATTASERSSTLWHTDNHFDSVNKIFFYLNDVGEKNAPFEYLRHKDTHATIRVQSSWPQRYPEGRVPADVIKMYLDRGYEQHTVTGPAGSGFLFDNKNIHKGNHAREGYRDALAIQITASDKKQERYVDPAWTTAL